SIDVPEEPGEVKSDRTPACIEILLPRRQRGDNRCPSEIDGAGAAKANSLAGTNQLSGGSVIEVQFDPSTAARLRKQLGGIANDRRAAVALHHDTALTCDASGGQEAGTRMRGQHQ